MAAQQYFGHHVGGVTFSNVFRMYFQVKLSLDGLKQISKLRIQHNKREAKSGWLLDKVSREIFKFNFKRQRKNFVLSVSIFSIDVSASNERFMIISARFSLRFKSRIATI